MNKKYYLILIMSILLIINSNFILGENLNFKILNISNIVHNGGVGLPINPRDMIIRDNLLYTIVINTNLFKEINISNTPLTEIGSIALGGGTAPYDLSFINDKTIGVVGYSTKTLYLINITNKSNVYLNKTYTNTTSLNGAIGIINSNNWTYIISDAGDSLTILNTTNALNPIQTAYYTNSTYLNAPIDIVINNEIIYIVSNTNKSLTALNVSNKTNPVQIAYYTNSTYLNNTNSILINNGYLYASFYNGISVFNISNPNNIVLLNSFVNTSSIIMGSDLAFINNYLVVLSQLGNFITVLNVSNFNFTQLYNYSNVNLNAPVKIGVNNNKIYVSNSGGDSIQEFEITSNKTLYYSLFNNNYPYGQDQSNISYFNETSLLFLKTNISDGNITNANLVFNGTNRGNASFYDENGFRYFTRSYGNNPIVGNYTYYWNITTLQSSGEILNFTLNGTLEVISRNLQLNYSFSSIPSTTYINEPFTLYLNSSVNTSLSNITQAILFYNGTNYGVTSSSVVGNNTLFSHVLTSNVTGNVSYYWNISILKFTGEVFNFTLNSSIQINAVNFNITLKDESTNALLTGFNTTILLQNLDTLQQFTINNNLSSFYFTNLTSGNYYIVVTPSTSSYLSKVLYNTINSTSDNNLTIYLNNNSQTLFKILVKDQNDNEITGVTVRLRKRSIINNFTYLTLSDCITDENGVCYLYIEESTTTLYSFIIIQDGIYIKTTPDSPIVTLPNTEKIITIRVDTGENLIEPIEKALNIYGNIVISNNFSNFTFIDGNNEITGACLEVYQRTPPNQFGYVNSQCQSGVTSGVISYNFTSLLINNTEIRFVGIVNYTTNTQILDTRDYQYRPTLSSNNSNENDGLLMVVILLFVIGFATVWIPNIYVQLGIQTAVLIGLTVLNMNFLGVGIVMGYLALGIFINWQRKTNRGEY